ncbi:MAG: ArnT family glycosyltransferase [Candidatus Woesearchaeota archaeon]
MNPARKRQTILFILLIIILLSSLIVRTLPVRNDYHYWDETVYLQNAEVLIGEQPQNHYHEWDLRPPLFSLILGLIMFFTTSLPAIHIMISLLATSTIFFTYLLGRQAYDRKTGVLAAAFMGLSYAHIILSHDLLVDPILPLFWILTTYFFLKATKTKARKDYILTGIMTGLAILMKFTSLMLAIIIPITMLYQKIVEVKKRKKERVTTHILKALRHTFSEQPFLSWSLATFLTLTPYLVWNTLTYGNPIHAILTGLSHSGGKDPIMRYILHATELLPLIALTGLVLFIPQLKKFKKASIHTPFLFSLALIIPLQFLIINKELRFMLAVVPYLAIMAAHGYMSLPIKKRIYSHILTGVLITGIIITAITLPPEDPHTKQPYIEHLKEGRLQTNGWHPPLEQASEWLANHTDENMVIYTNHNWPGISYYSKQRVIITSIYKQGENLSAQFTERGYVIHSPHTPANSSENLLEIIKNNSDFSKVKRFDDMTIYQYEPANSTEAIFER